MPLGQRLCCNDLAMAETDRPHDGARKFAVLDLQVRAQHVLDIEAARGSGDLVGRR